MGRTTQQVVQHVRIEQLGVLHPHAAGVDISADEIIAAVPSDCDDRPVRAFGTFTIDL